MKKQLLIGMGGLLVIGGLLAACFVGCQQAEPKPNPGKTTTTKSSQTTTTTTEFIPQTTTTTKFDPLGYEDLVDAEEWPWRIFNSIEGFIHWIENPNFKVEDSPLEPEKDDHGYDVYKRSYFEALYPDYQEMFAVDRFYMLPDVPSDWKLTNIYVDRSKVGFTYQDKEKNEYYYAYVYSKSGKLDVNNPKYLAFKKEVNNQEYYIVDVLPVEDKKSDKIKTLVNGYLCVFTEKTYNPDKKDSATKGYERVIYSEDTDLTDAISKIKFKRIDLPPLK